MVEISVGSELDMAVAEAIGWRIDEGRPLDWMGSNGVSVEEFQPSTDLNDAFMAAEKVGLFDVERDGPEVHLAKTFDGQWEILTGGSAMGYVSRESTPTLAICAAVLELKAANA